MVPSPIHEKAIAIAMSLLQQKNPQAIQTLKDLLTFIPNPNHTKEILTTAVVRLIYTCPESILWLFQHPEVVAPEIQVRDIVAQELTRILCSWGYALESFHFTSERYLVMQEDSRQLLLSGKNIPVNEPILILIRSLLQ